MGFASRLQWTTFCVSMDLLASPGGYQLDESAGLRAAVCKAAGLPEDRAQEAMQHLIVSKPGELQALVQQHGNFTAQVLDVELATVKERMGVLLEEVKDVKGGVQEVHGGVQAVMLGVKEVKSALQQYSDKLEKAKQSEERRKLAGFLKDWWIQAAGSELVPSMPLVKFFKRLIQWFKDNK